MRTRFNAEIGTYAERGDIVILPDGRTGKVILPQKAELLGCGCCWEDAGASLCVLNEGQDQDLSMYGEDPIFKIDTQKYKPARLTETQYTLFVFRERIRRGA